MATTKKPRGRMTKPITTRYEVGDVVRNISPDLIDVDGKCLRQGDVGTVHRIVISDPNDGDDTFLLFYVNWQHYGGRMHVIEQDIEPYIDREAEAWLRRQIEGLTK